MAYKKVQHENKLRFQHDKLHKQLEHIHTASDVLYLPLRWCTC